MKHRYPCSLCNGEGALIFEEMKDGRRVAYAYQCNCKNSARHPRLPPPNSGYQQATSDYRRED